MKLEFRLSKIDVKNCGGAKSTTALLKYSGANNGVTGEIIIHSLGDKLDLELDPKAKYEVTIAKVEEPKNPFTLDSRDIELAQLKREISRVNTENAMLEQILHDSKIMSRRYSDKMGSKIEKLKKKIIKLKK